MAGGVERVLTIKANYFAETFGYDITIILTEGKDRTLFYPLSDKINIINLDINFEDLWTCSFIKKVFVYLRKQRLYKKMLTRELVRIRPDITVSLMRREINFITSVKDGSKKIGELHVNKANYRNFESNNTNFIKNIFAKFWMSNLKCHIRKLDKFVVLTEEDKHQWGKLENVIAIPDPLSLHVETVSMLSSKRVIAVGRYVYQKGFDLLLQAWSIVEKQFPEWSLAIYGQGDRKPYENLIDNYSIDKKKCILHGPTNDIIGEYCKSSIFAFSSRFEGFGMVLVEAMSCGLPVVSFDCPCGPKDIIKDGEDGILVENGNVEEFAHALISLMEKSTKRKIMAKNAVRNVQRYSIEQIAHKWETLFNSI